MSGHLHIVIDGLLPPSVNAYVRHTRAGAHYKTSEATAFLDAAVLFSRKAEAKQGELPKLKSTRYEVMVVVYQGKGDRGDIDNRAKLPLDALVAARVITSDAAVVDCTLRKREDRNAPRTEIWVREARPATTTGWGGGHE